MQFINWYQQSDEYFKCKFSEQAHRTTHTQEHTPTD